MRINKQRKQIKNKTSIKEENKYTLIPEGYEKEYEKHILKEEYKKYLGNDNPLTQDSDKNSGEVENSKNRRTIFLEDLKFDSNGNTIVIKKQINEEIDINSIITKFLIDKNLDLNAGIKIKLNGRSSVIINYRDDKGVIHTEKISTKNNDEVEIEQ